MAEQKSSENGLYPVRFVQAAAPYNAGDVAGFPLDKAARMVELGFARWAPETVPAPVQKETRKPEPVSASDDSDEGPAAEEPERPVRRRRFGSRSE